MRIVLVKTVCAATIMETWQIAVPGEVEDGEALNAALTGTGEVLGVETEIMDERDREVMTVEEVD